MHYFYKRRFGVKISSKMRKNLASSVLALGFLIPNLGGQSTPSGPLSTSEMRRTYPGGRDDSDLTVQTLRKITRKGDDAESHYSGHVEPVEDSSGGE